MMTVAITLTGFTCVLMYLYVMHAVHYDLAGVRELCADLTP